MPENPKSSAPSPESGAARSRPSRFRAAWSVMLGRQVVPEQIVAEWAEYQQIFSDLLQRWSASLARQAKAEKDRARQLSDVMRSLESEESPASRSPAAAGRKLELRRRAAPFLGRHRQPGSRGNLALAQPHPEEEAP